jgi:DeoR family transcriptional regulator, glycerol-3-phosphate regulon repressor
LENPPGIKKEYGLPALTPRQADIVTLARGAGRLDVDALAARFQVTPQTIRKDLNELCEHGVLQRFHGGAMLASGVANLAYEARRQLATEGKRRIGEKAAQLIPDGCSLLINIGTTTEQVAMALRSHQGLMVITNNINVVNILQGYSSIEVIVAGGVLRHSDGGIVGEPAVDFLRQFKVDYAIIGASAIEEDGALLDFDYREVEVARKIMQSSRRTILVADSLKYGRSAPVRIGHISDIDHFVTDQPPPPRLRKVCEENKVAIELATESANAEPASAR